MKTRKLACTVLFLGIVAILPASLMADGYAFPSVKVQRSDISVPGQQALVIFDGSKETLVLRIQFTGKGDDFAWIIPVPNEPKVDTCSSAPFAILDAVSPPRVVTSEFLIIPGALAMLLVITFPVLVTSKSVLFWARAMIVISFGAAAFLLIILPSFSSMGGTGTGVRAVPGVTVHEIRTIGPYDISVVSSVKPRALSTWFEKNEYFLPDGAIPIIDSYARENWYFVAARLSSDYMDEVTKRNIVPLKLTFATERAVYPLKLTSLSSGRSGILIYVLGKHFYRARRFRSELRRLAHADLRKALEVRCGISLDAFPHLYLTKLYGSLSPSQMKRDLYLVRNHIGLEYRCTVYTKEAQRYALIIIIVCVVLMWADLRLPLRFSKKIPFACFVFVALILCQPWGLLAPSHHNYHEQWVRGRGAREASLKSNMHTLQLAMEGFSKMAQGYYPADLNTTVKEVLRQAGIDSDNDTSIVGAWGGVELFGGEIGSSGPAILPENFRNPFPSRELPARMLVKSLQDPPDWRVPGVVFYVPLGVDGHLATGYKIYGAGRDELLVLILTSEDSHLR